MTPANAAAIATVVAVAAAGTLYPFEEPLTQSAKLHTFIGSEFTEHMHKVQRHKTVVQQPYDYGMLQHIGHND